MLKRISWFSGQNSERYDKWCNIATTFTEGTEKISEAGFIFYPNLERVATGIAKLVEHAKFVENIDCDIT